MVFWFIIEHTMLPIFFLVVLGYFLDKKFHLDVKTLSKLMFFLVIPSFIFTNIYTTQFPATSINIIAAIAIFMVICFVIALPLSLWIVNRWMASFAYRAPFTVWIPVAALAAVLLVTAATVTFCSWRTANENPAESVKSE